MPANTNEKGGATVSIPIRIQMTRIRLMVHSGKKQFFCFHFEWNTIFVDLISRLFPFWLIYYFILPGDHVTHAAFVVP